MELRLPFGSGRLSPSTGQSPAGFSSFITTQPQSLRQKKVLCRDSVMLVLKQVSIFSSVCLAKPRAACG
ncbi:unnamed protein product [Cuscuta campestris]|uniref:Uncharacterized protein n=1 Tax=Cuscuta campestris TaxID=132261 RepID=A0A484MK95_9ASTE|nr:unnamed protein product [Cuscuta campestris]